MVALSRLYMDALGITLAGMGLFLYIWNEKTCWMGEPLH